MDILRDSIWQFIGALLGLIAIAVTIYIYFLQRNKKRLTYEILSKSLIVSVDQEVKSDIQITYKGKEIQDMSLVILKFSNTGTIPISSSDYESPIQLTFGSDSEILNADIVECKPKSLSPIISTSQNISAEIKPILLNPKDSFTAKIIVLKFSNIIEVKGRILGINDIENLTNPVTKENELTKIIIPYAVGFVLCSFIFGAAIGINNPFAPIYISIIFVAGLLSFGISFWNFLKK